MKRVYLRCVNESQCYFWRSNEVWFHCVRAVSSCGYQPVLPKRGHYYAITFLICVTNKPVSIYPCTFNLNGNKIFLICVWFGIMQLTPISYSIISLQPAWIKKKVSKLSFNHITSGIIIVIKKIQIKIYWLKKNSEFHGGSEIKSRKDTPHLAPRDELWCVFCGNFGENWPRYSGTATYIVYIYIDLRFCPLSHDLIFGR